MTEEHCGLCGKEYSDILDGVMGVCQECYHRWVHKLLEVARDSNDIQTVQEAVNILKEHGNLWSHFHCLALATLGEILNKEKAMKPSLDRWM